MSRNVRIANFLGAPLARAPCGAAASGVDREQGIRWVVDGLKRVLDVATPLGVTLAIENHTKSFFWTHYDFAMQADVYLEIVRQLRGTAVRVQFDTANPIVCKYDALAVLDEVADLVVCIHTNDADTPGEFKFVPIGTGIGADSRDVPTAPQARLRRLGLDRRGEPERRGRIPTGRRIRAEGVGRRRALIQPIPTQRTTGRRLPP